MGVTGGDVPEHDHIVDTGKSSFGLDELGHIQPGLARIMPEIGARIWKCYYAGKAGNQPLARFQLKEAVNLMEMGAFVRPKYEENMTKFIAEDVEQVKQAIEAKDWDKFETAFHAMIDQANSYHARLRQAVAPVQDPGRSAARPRRDAAAVGAGASTTPLPPAADARTGRGARSAPPSPAMAVIAKPDHPSTHENPSASSRDHSPARARRSRGRAR